ncbi:MAG TPA: hypothetical protein VGS11_06695 [Candidatus Bathyarchaeia archaeon]|nr:hypothetical protein [Candidatus Bathyarchaeia archaeon]
MRSPRSIPLIAALFVAILFGTLVLPSYASSYRPGVKVGDSAYYSVTTIPAYPVGQSVTRMSVQSVTGTIVNASFFGFYPDGGVPAGFSIDVFSGQSYNSTSNFFFVIASGLKSGDPIFNNWNITVAGQSDLSCGGVTRPAVGAQFTRAGQSVRLAWDQATGAMCGYTGQDNRGALYVNMINSTFWTPVQAPIDTFTVAAEISSVIGLPLVVIVLFVFFRRRRARKGPP